jgi:MiaB-like tRNA modifying enzyme
MAKIFVESYGCSANSADMEIVMGILVNGNHIVVDKLNEADAAIVLTCTVKTPTERKVMKRLKSIEKSKMPLIVAGCMPKAQRELLELKLPNSSLLGPDNLENVNDAVRTSIEGRKNVYLESVSLDKTCLPRIRRNKVIHIQPISSGCLGNCSYCIVKNARGSINSFSYTGIIHDVKEAIINGCMEIWITAEDTAAYRNEETSLPGLIKQILELKEEFRIRIGMMTPNQANPLLDDLIDVINNRKIYNFLHLPLQSGSDEILKKMRRKYSIGVFLDLVKKFREKIKNLTVSTDIICGFPGETEAQFEESLNIIEQVRPEILNISRFWPRPGTEAATLPEQVHGRITKERSRKLTKVWRKIALEKGQEWVGWQGKVLVNEHGKKGYRIGRNFAYKAIAFPSDIETGRFVDVEVTQAKVGYLLGTES